MTTIPSIVRTLLLTLLCLPGTGVTTVVQAATTLDSVAIIVNNSVITQSQLKEAMGRLKGQLQSSGQPVPSDAALKQQATDQLIGQALQLQVAQRAKIVVSDQQVTEAISKIAQQNKISPDQLKQELAKEGISYTHFRKQIHDQLVVHQIQQQALGSKVQLNDADVRAYMRNQPGAANNTQYHLDDLLVPLSDTPSADELAAATKKANDLMQQARAGTSLSQLSQNDSTQTLEYSDLDWRTQKELPAVFAKSLPTLKPKDVAGPIRAPNGLHIIRLLEVRNNTKSLSFEEAKQMLLQQKFKEQSDKWVQELRKTAYIKTVNN